MRIASRSDRGGFLFVAAGAALWGTDAVFRRGLALELPAATLVFAEHAVLVLVTAPWLWRYRAHLRNLGSGDWLAAVVIGAGSSALATILFTSAFRYGDPTTPLLLQKIQPLIVVAAARLLLGERLLSRYIWFLAGGLSGAYLVAFPEPTAVSVAALTPALLAVGAAALWGLGTVLGRRLAPKLPFTVLTALRFAIGLPAAGLFMSLGSSNPAGPLLEWTDVPGIVALALIPGLLALLLYYRGLRSTPAAAATIAELAFPLTATGLNYLIFGTVLTLTQWLGVSLLAGTIGVMSWLSRVGNEESLGVRLESSPTPEVEGSARPSRSDRLPICRPEGTATNQASEEWELRPEVRTYRVQFLKSPRPFDDRRRKHRCAYMSREIGTMYGFPLDSVTECPVISPDAEAAGG